MKKTENEKIVDDWLAENDPDYGMIVMKGKHYRVGKKHYAIAERKTKDISRE